MQHDHPTTLLAATVSRYGLRVKILASLLTVAGLGCLASAAGAQLPFRIHQGDAIPHDVREIYNKGAAFLVKSQADDGSWRGGQQGPGVTGMALMVLLASGEDPNFGMYSPSVRKAVQSLVGSQDASTGYLGNSMYHHGFGMLALAEAYGTVDDRAFWRATFTQKKSIGVALELAVRCAITSQEKNPLGAWRYSPDAHDADTSVSGAILVGLLAARNAGIEVPDAAIDRAISYYQGMTSENGNVGYSGGIGGGMGESVARTSIASLVYAVSRRQDLPKYKATVTNLTSNLESEAGHYKDYARYYQSQALFQGDMEAWEKWNKMLVEKLKATQHEDGSFRGDFGVTESTALNLLALALNYRFLPIYER
jgi:hypothetical protein